jgi:very-short-patch-repair endonuclease
VFLCGLDHVRGGWVHKERSVAALSRRAARQYGVIARHQALEHVGRRTIDGLIAREELQAIRRGIYRLAGAPGSWKQQLMAAQLAAGDEGVVCGRSAAALLALNGFGGRRPEIAVDRPLRLSGITVRRMELLPSEIRRHGPFRVTSVERTLLDVAASVPPAVLENIIDTALNKGLTTIPRLQDYISKRATKGRRGVVALREMVNVRDPGSAPHESVLETKLASLIRRSILPSPQPQFVVEGPHGFVAKIDFAYPVLRLAVEAMGWEYHGGRLRWKRDLHRLNQLTNLGWRTLVFTWSDVATEPERTLRTIQDAYSSPIF